MKPLLTHSYPPLTVTLPACLLPITKFLTTKEQRNWVSFCLNLLRMICLLHIGTIVFFCLIKTRIEMKTSFQL